MNLLDRLIGAISPRAGAERQYWREVLERSSAYDAASSGRLQSQWTVQNHPAEVENSLDRDAIRARARDLERNSDIENAVLRAYRRNVVGAGVHVRATTPDQEISKKLEKLWKQWCKRRNCDVTGTQSLNQILRMLIQRKIVDGGILVLKRYTRYGVLPFQLQVLEVDDLDSARIVPKTQGNRVVGGIELNSFNRPEGYWIRQTGVDGFGVLPSVYVEAKDVIYYFSKIRPTQIREISDMAPTVIRLKDINEFMNATVVKEKIAASLAVFIKRTNPAVGTFGNRNGQAKGPDVTYAGKRIVPGMIMEMNPGDEAQFLEPKSAGSDASTFVKLMQRMVSSAHGLSYEATSRDMSGTTYSSARQSLIEDDLTYNEEREGMTDVFLEEVYETFVISCWLAGKISAPDFWEHREDYMSHEWVIEPRRWIDPKKESDANRIALQTAQKTFQQICSEYGRDWKTVVNEMAEAIAYAEEKGVDLAKILYKISEDPEEEAGETGEGEGGEEENGDEGQEAYEG